MTGFIRTIVPMFWGQLVAWALGVFPILAPWREQLLAQGSPIADAVAFIIVPAVGTVISAAWYAFWRWLQPRLPGWFVTAVLGSAKTPIYTAQHQTVKARHAAGDPQAYAGPVYPVEHDPRAEPFDPECYDPADLATEDDGDEPDDSHGGKHVAREG